MKNTVAIVYNNHTFWLWWLRRNVNEICVWWNKCSAGNTKNFPWCKIARVARSRWWDEHAVSPEHAWNNFKNHTCLVTKKVPVDVARRWKSSLISHYSVKLVLANLTVFRNISWIQSLFRSNNTFSFFNNFTSLSSYLKRIEENIINYYIVIRYI